MGLLDNFILLYIIYMYYYSSISYQIGVVTINSKDL